MNKRNLFCFGTLFTGITVVLCAVRCSFGPFSGGGTEGGNVVAGVFVDEGGAAVKAFVGLVPAGFNPGVEDRNKRVITTLTSENGGYSFEHVAEGRYSIEAIDTSNEIQTLITGVTVSGEDVRLDADTLRTPGTLRIDPPEEAETGTGYLYMPGTTVWAPVDSITGYVHITVPSATLLPPLCYGRPDTPDSVVLRYNLLVTPGDTVIVVHAGWTYMRRFILNTSATGAGIPIDVTDFPVLLRLTENNFNFASAAADGGDIRFARSDTVGLPYEIERWDATVRRAEIWVRLDTIFGNNDSQTVTMYWGNSAAVVASDPETVFDTANGFAGVWHLGESGQDLDDATADAHDGRNSGSAATEGVIGTARVFASGDFIRVPGLLGTPADVTLSAWVRSENAEGRQDIISIGDAVLIRIDDVEEIGTAGSYHNSTVVNDSMYAIVSSGQYIVNTGWHYIVFSVDAATHTQTLYIDGVQSAVSYDVNPINYDGLGPDTYFGIHGNGKTIFNFIGRIDEARIHDVVVSADRIKLCYMNQKEVNSLVEW